MWAKLRKELHFEGRRFFPVGTILFLRRVGIIKRSAEGNYGQYCSGVVAEVEDDFILVLPEESEGDLYDPWLEPPPGGYPIPRAQAK